MASSADAREDEISSVDSYHIVSQLSDAPRVTSLPEAHAQENIVTVESPQGHSTSKKWLQRIGIKGSPLQKPDRHSGKSREPAPSHSPAGVDDRHEGPSRMAAGRRKPVSALL